jgi:glycosyltransferase involved in cell wall biosynthesis
MALDIVIPCLNPTRDLITIVSAIDDACKLYKLGITINIFDDCSGNTEAYSCLRPQFAQLVIYKTQKSLGEYENVNRAISNLSKEGRDWFLLLHADDLASPEWLAWCAQYVSRYEPSMPALVYCLNEGVRQLPDLPISPPINICKFSEKEITIPAGREGIEYISKYWSWIPSGTLMRIDRYLTMGGFHPDLRCVGDNDFLVRWLLAGLSIRFVNSVGLFKRLHPDSMSSRNIKTGGDNEGWCYLMVRYSYLMKPREILDAHVKWFYENLRTLVRALRKRDGATIASRWRGMVMVPLSLSVIVWPKLSFVLPAAVRSLLTSAPSLVEPSTPIDAHRYQKG